MTETSIQLSEPVGHEEMLTHVLPLAPNPVLDGHLVHMLAEEVLDVEMSVEEGIQAVATSSVAVPSGTGGEAGQMEETLQQLASVVHADQQLTPGMNSPNVRRFDAVDPQHSEAYGESNESRRATTMDDIARPERPGDIDGVDDDMDGGSADETVDAGRRR